jgi:phenylpropionate dioxygenase-like ring-hydroxylating dioxygenase large terminal subunit
VEVIGAAVQVIESERIAPPRDLSFNPQDWAILAKCWHPVARSDALGEKPIQARLLDVDLVVYRAAGRAIVARNLCVHRGTQRE